MNSHKKEQGKSIKNSLYYGIATAEYDIFDNDLQDAVDTYFYENNNYIHDSQDVSQINFISSLEKKVIKKSKLFASIWERSTSAILRVSNFLVRIPMLVLWFILLSFFSLYVGITIINSTNIGFGYVSNEQLYNGMTIVMINPLLINEGARNQETLDTSNLKELAMNSYTLKKGDTLLALAIKFDLNVDTLVSVNFIQDASSIQIGQEILVPTQNGIIHTIRRNETLSSIANKYTINKNAIVDINNLQSEILSTGRQLFIPNTKMNWFDLGLILGTVFQWPAKGRLTSGYGYRVSPITGRRHFHGAIDIANRIGTPVVAAATGIVTIAGTNVVYGKHIEIKHLNGYKTLYTHLHSMYVRRGQRVGRGSTIGTMGNTGHSTGSHLHFSVLKNGKYENPLRYIRFQ